MPLSSKKQNPQHKNNYSIAASKRELYAGPLPHPDMLKRFEEVVPGSAERILCQFEKQSDHRRSLEVVVIKHDKFLSTTGLVCGFIIAMFAIGAGLYAATLGLSTFASVVGGSGLVGLVSVFIYGSQAKRKHLKEREG